MWTRACWTSQRPEQRAHPLRANRCWVTGERQRTDSAFKTMTALDGGLRTQVGELAPGTYKCNHSLSTASPGEIAMGAFCHDKRRGHALFVGGDSREGPNLRKPESAPVCGLILPRLLNCVGAAPGVVLRASLRQTLENLGVDWRSRPRPYCGG